MIRRLFYMALGAYLATWAQRRLRALKPDHLARRAADQVRGFADDVRDQASHRETELRARFGLDTVSSTQTHLPPNVRDGR
ncbi:hypothetical protein Aph01nite_12550 [Acrocarpospora phusangensis]|uniref:Uncharacterized protein n=1 Tax=Acrocarpospora phusangensis TaxID=1070424 RepID=A0A919QA60_9ACTN|nr:hypothetical protein [Acrocarpospora phusangensis]GIH22945.1 hypothetical protein Aph01nite_12550 [Acrocarpospora phusangensis]